MSDASPPDLDLLTQLFGANLPESAEDMRALVDRFGGLVNLGAPDVGAFHERVPVREAAGISVTADVAVPKGSGPHPVLVYFHGGGWICGSPATHRKLGLRFAEAGHLVFNVDYRLAPEDPFPAPLEDCIAAIHWAAEVASQYGGDASRLAVGGDSAGGNLAAAAAAALADDRAAPKIRAALLIYGVFDFASLADETLEAPEGMSALLQGDGADGLGRKMVDLMIGSYLGSDPSPDLLADPRVSPVHVAAKLPPCHVVVGSADPLVGQAKRMAGELARAGVPHEHVVLERMPHGFAQMEFLPEARQSIESMAAFLAKHMGQGGGGR